MVPSYRKRLLLALSFAFILAGCDATISIDSPVKNEKYSSPPPIELSFIEGIPSDLQVEINGHDITSDLSINSSGATAPGSVMLPYLKDGNNKLAVVSPESVSVTFQFDLSAPAVHIIDVNDGGGLTVGGYVSGGLQDLSFNGKSVHVDGSGRFSANISDADFVDVVSVGHTGNTAEATYARPRVELDNALAVRVTGNAVDFMETEVARLLSGSNLGDLLLVMNPLKTDSILGNSYTVNATSASMGTPQVNLEIVGDRRFFITGNMPEINVGLEVEIDPLIGWDFSVTGDVGANNSSFESYASITVRNGQIVLDIDDLSIDLTGIQTDIDNFPDWLISPIINLFEGLIERILANEIEKILPGKVTQFLEIMPENLILAIDGKEIKPDILPESIDTVGDNIDIEIGSHIYSLESNGNTALGSLYVETGPLPSPTHVTPSGQARDVGVVMSVNMLNQAMVAAFEAGILNMTVNQSDIPELANLGNGQGTFRVRMLPASPPELRLVSSGSALGRCTMRDVTLRFETKPAGESNYTLFFGTTVDVEAFADLNVTPENDALVIEFSGVPEVEILDIDDSGVIDSGEAIIRGLVKRFTPMVLPYVMNEVGAIPIPAFEGYTMKVADIWVMDDKAHFVALAADLISLH